MNDPDDILSDLKSFAQSEHGQKAIRDAMRPAHEVARENVQRHIQSTVSEHASQARIETRLTEISQNTSESAAHGRTTNTILSRGVGLFARFAEKQPPPWLSWATVLLAFVGIVLSGISLYVSVRR